MQKSRTKTYKWWWLLRIWQFKKQCTNTINFFVAYCLAYFQLLLDTTEKIRLDEGFWPTCMGICVLFDF